MEDPPAPPAPAPADETVRVKRRRLATATELDLRAHRKMASTALMKSRQQERIYVTKKEADFGRQEAHKAKIHFRNARRNFRMGMVCSWHEMASLPAMCREKLYDWKQQRTVKQAERTQKKLDGMNFKRMKESESEEETEAAPA